MYCSGCGNDVGADAAFCTRCGMKANAVGTRVHITVTNPRVGKGQQLGGCLLIIFAVVLAGSGIHDAGTGAVVGLIFLAGVVLWIIGRGRHWWHWK